MTVNLLKRLESSVRVPAHTREASAIHLSTPQPHREFPPDGSGWHDFTDLSAAFEDAEPDEDVDFLDPEECRPISRPAARSKFNWPTWTCPPGSTT